MMMTDKMRTAFGYDSYGNSPELVCAHDEAELERGVQRACGTVICAVCGCTYNRHPVVQGATWATRTCDAGIVKL
jgi:hypothetical protein